MNKLMEYDKVGGTAVVFTIGVSKYRAAVETLDFKDGRGKKMKLF